MEFRAPVADVIVAAAGNTDKAAPFPNDDIESPPPVGGWGPTPTPFLQEAAAVAQARSAPQPPRDIIVLGAGMLGYVAKVVITWYLEGKGV